MLEKQVDLPDGVEGVKAVGKITPEDYANVLTPMLDDARSAGRRVRFLYEFGHEFDSFTPGAVWEDAKMGLGSMRLFDGCAVVSDIGWMRESARLVGFLMPFPVRIFRNRERDKAALWLSTLSGDVGVSHRLLPKFGIVLVDVAHPLRAEDFDALALTADIWIEARGSLHGIVIRAREFPGWENLGSHFKQLRLFRDHHRMVKRIALVTDGKSAGPALRFVEHFVVADVKTFVYDALESAIAWAREPEDSV